MPELKLIAMMECKTSLESRACHHTHPKRAMTTQKSRPHTSGDIRGCVFEFIDVKCTQKNASPAVSVSVTASAHRQKDIQRL